MSFLGNLRPDPTVLEQAKEIQALRKACSGVSDQSANRRSFRSIGKALGTLFKAACHIRYAFTNRIDAADWIVAMDGKRGGPSPNENVHSFLTHACRTNREAALPEIVGMKPSDQYVVLDLNQLFGTRGQTFGSLAFLFGLAQPSGLLRFATQVVVGLVATRSPGTAFLYGTLDMVRHRSSIFRQGLLMTTSSSWLVEALRCGVLSSRRDVKVVEVLHGASIKSVGRYFEWVHRQAVARPIYVNLIADLPRFSPQDTHLLTDDAGEIACNVRLWQDRQDKTVVIPRTRFETPAIVFIGGGSMDADYELSTFFAKELSLLSALKDRIDNLQIRYCVHPMHRKELQDRLIKRVEALGAVQATLSSPDEILAGRIVVGGFSTSLFEAALLGRQTFAYEDMGTLFIPEVAELVTYNSDIDALSAQIADASQDMSIQPNDAEFKLVSDHAKNRYGLNLALA